MILQLLSFLFDIAFFIRMSIPEPRESPKGGPSCFGGTRPSGAKFPIRFVLTEASLSSASQKSQGHSHLRSRKQVHGQSVWVGGASQNDIEFSLCAGAVHKPTCAKHCTVSELSCMGKEDLGAPAGATVISNGAIAGCVECAPWSLFQALLLEIRVILNKGRRGYFSLPPFCALSLHVLTTHTSLSKQKTKTYTQHPRCVSPPRPSLPCWHLPSWPSPPRIPSPSPRASRPPPARRPI